MAKTEFSLFISDLHLCEERPELTRAFLDFTERLAPQGEALYILGDFFNVWIGDDAESPLSRKVSNALSNLAASGTRIYLMHGNRDFLMAEKFTTACGAQFIAEPYELTCYGKHFLLMHGDALCTRDQDYMAFRKLVRNPHWQQEFLAKPLEERQAFAEQARRQSMSMSSNKAEDIMDVSQDEVEKVMAQYRVSTLIHGHTHRPAIHEFSLADKPARRIVLGDWDHQAWYLKITPHSERLLSAPLAAKGEAPQSKSG